MQKLREYQERADQVMLQEKFLYLQIDMGLGKTRIVLDFLNRTGQNALIVAPITVMNTTWPKEVKKWGYDLNHVILHGKDKNDLYFMSPRLKILNFEGLKWLYNMVLKNGSVDLKDRILIIDEGTRIKNPKSVSFKVLKALRHFFKSVYVLSGTPLPNGYQNLWSQYYILDNGQALGPTYARYMGNYFIVSGPPRWSVTLRDGADKVIDLKAAPITFRLRAEDHLTLPPVTTSVLPVELPKDVRMLYRQMEKDSVAEHGDQVFTGVTAAATQMKLRQIAQGAVYNEDKTYTVLHTEKIRVLRDLVDSLDGDPLLCAIQFKFELEMLKKEFGQNTPVIAGGIKPREAARLIDEWNDKKLPLLLCHPSSLSHGVNLQDGGRNICWLGMTWDLEQYQQLNGRLHRSGQTLPVNIIHIVIEKSVEQDAAKALQVKDVTQQSFQNAIYQYWKSLAQS